MENDDSVSDPREEVRKLKEKVKALEFQLSQQSSSSRSEVNGSSFKSEIIGSDPDCEVLPLDKLVDLSNSKLWLEVSPLEEVTDQDPFTALRRDSPKDRILYEELCRAEQERSGRRGIGMGIDSRTFTRPKKRMGRPSLELFESLSRMPVPDAGDPVPVLPWTAETKDVELLNDMTCSLLDSSVINSLIIYETSPESESQASVSFINKKQKVMPSSNEEIISDDVSNYLDDSVNKTITDSSKFDSSAQPDEVVAMEMSPPADLEKTYKSLGIKLADSGVNIVGIDSTNQENSLNIPCIQPKDCRLPFSEDVPNKDKLPKTFSSVRSYWNDSVSDFLNNFHSPIRIKDGINTTFTPSPDEDMNSVGSSSEECRMDATFTHEPRLMNATFISSSNDVNTTVTHLPKDVEMPPSNRLQPSTNVTKRLLNTTFSPAEGESFLGKFLSNNLTLSKDYKNKQSSAVISTNMSSENVSFDASPSNGMHVQKVSPYNAPQVSTCASGSEGQLSRTPDSNQPSAPRLMSMGDVRNIARLQEESLVVSTPKEKMDSSKPWDDFEKVSPIISGPASESEIGTATDGSDRSHSSRSPLSSLQSSPANSPFGSSSALPTTQAQSNLHSDQKTAARPNGLLQRRDTYSMIAPTKSKVMGLRPPTVSSIAPPRAPVAAAAAVRSGLRPPMVHARASGAASTITTGLPRPSGTGIPRPSQATGTRIPPPKIRAPSASRKKEWTDECY